MNRILVIVISAMVLSGQFGLANATAICDTITGPKNLTDFLILNSHPCDTLSSARISEETATLVLQKSVDNTSPDPGEPFNYILDMACNSTSRDCESAIVVDCLDPDLVFINLSDPLPDGVSSAVSVSYTHLRAHETREDLVCRLLLEKKKESQK